VSGVIAALVLLVVGVARATGGGAVATEHRLAAAAGADVLVAGGSAADAAIAAAAAVCVVHASSCGVGGGGFALGHDTSGSRWALDFRERAPAAATPERYLVDGRPAPERTRVGGLAVAVPGEIAGWAALHRRRGHVPLAVVLAPAVRLAREGFLLADAPHLAREIARNAELLGADAGLRAQFLLPDGSVPPPSFRVVQADLARTLEAAAAGGPQTFYDGPTAGSIARAVAARGGVLDEKDLATYRPVWRRPLVGTFRGRRVLAFPPPGSGAVVLTVLGLLAHDDLPVLEAASPTFLHLLASAFSVGFSDRATWYGDPAFTRVPLESLLAPSRLGTLRDELSAVRVAVPPTTLRPDAGTAHVSVIDGAGNAVALTTTINTAFGAGILVPGTGIILNNEMDDFVAAPGGANVYGLTGGTANVIAPGKRPQSSMSPTIILEGTRPELVAGGSGGPLIISGTLQVILGVTTFGLDPAAAVASPRIHAQGGPTLAVEPGIPGSARAPLERIGHRIVDMPALGAVAAVGRGPDGTIVAAGDPRKDGGAVVLGR